MMFEVFLVNIDRMNKLNVLIVFFLLFQISSGISHSTQNGYFLWQLLKTRASPRVDDQNGRKSENHII